MFIDGNSPRVSECSQLAALEAGPDDLDGFDAELFDELVEKIIVDSNEQIRFRLKNGLELCETIRRTIR